MKIAVVKEKASSMLEVLRDPQGPRSNFEIGGGAPLLPQYWDGGGHKTLFLTNSL